MVKCKREWMFSQFMKDTFDEYKFGNMYCVDNDNPEIYFLGTKNDQI